MHVKFYSRKNVRASFVGDPNKADVADCASIILVRRGVLILPCNLHAPVIFGSSQFTSAYSLVPSFFSLLVFQRVSRQGPIYLR